jgi:hypothetical protein
MPKYHWLPFLDERISGSRLPARFFVDGEAAISVASTIAPYRSGEGDWIKVKTGAWREANKDRGELFEKKG